MIKKQLVTEIRDQAGWGPQSSKALTKFNEISKDLGYEAEPFSNAGGMSRETLANIYEDYLEGVIKKVLENCDFYSCECYRDVELAKQYGFKGHQLPVYPNTGGFNTNLIKKIKVNLAIHHPKNPKINIKNIPASANQSLRDMKAEMSNSPLKSILNGLFKTKK